MHSGDDEGDEKNDLQKFQQLLKSDHPKPTLLVVFVDTPKKWIEVDNVIPLGCENREERDTKSVVRK